MKDTFCFAQVSDPHLSSLEQVQWPDLVNKRVLGYLSWRRRRRMEHRSEVLDALRTDLEQTAPEHIAVTGDLTHIGLPDEFRQARGWLESLGEPWRVTVVPGNHDAYIAARWDESLAHWREYLESDDPAAIDPATPEQGVFPSLRIRGPVALIGLSTATPSPPFMATGTLGDRQLQRLGELLEGTGRQGLFRVAKPEKKRLIEIPGTHVPVFGIPSASAIGLRPGREAQYHLYTVRRAETGWQLDVAVRAYQAETETFAEVEQTRLEIGT